MARTKISLKLLIMLGLALLTISIFNTNVNAAEITQEDIQAMIDLIPKNMDINLPEVEYKEAKAIIRDELDKIFISNNIDTKNVDITVSLPDFMGIEELHKATIYFEKTIDGSTNHLGETSILLKYNNADKYNSDDENYVKSLVIPKIEYHTIDIKEWEKEDIWEEAFEKAGKDYTKLVNDPTITIKCTAGAGDSNGPFTLAAGDGGALKLLIFKDGILYDYRINYPGLFLAELTVPSNILENKVDEYIKNTIQKYSHDNIITVKKGTEEGYENGYTITYSYNDIHISTPMIIKREVANVDIIDKTTNIKLDATTAVVPEGTKLVAEEVTTGASYNIVLKAVEKDVSKFVLYDINLMNNNAKIQPNGKVKVSIPVPIGYDTSKIVVYRVADDGTKTKYDTTIINGYIVFETDHFSNYVVAEEKETTTTIENTTPQETTKEHIKDETPKTGSNDIAIIISSILSVLSVAGIAIVKKI